MQNFIVAIGRNVGDKPLTGEEWQRFRRDVELTVIGTPDASVIASVKGVSRSDGWGNEHAAWFAGSISANYVPTFKRELASLAYRYGQDAIALTLGSTDLITANA